MTVYLASPGSQATADAARGMPVLISYALWSDWMERYQHSWGPLLIDSGAYSVWQSGAKVDIEKYRAWAMPWIESLRADAVAGLDDMEGDWKQSLKNYEQFPEGFPTIHETDPIELLKDLIALARSRKPRPGCRSNRPWIGVSIVKLTAKQGMEWTRRVCDMIPEDLHIHAWGMRAYWKQIPRIDSVDSTNWFRDAGAYTKMLPFLTPAQATQIVVWRYQQERRMFNVSGKKEGFFE